MDTFPHGRLIPNIGADLEGTLTVEWKTIMIGLYVFGEMATEEIETGEIVEGIAVVKDLARRNRVKQGGK